MDKWIKKEIKKEKRNKKKNNKHLKYLNSEK